MPTKHHWLQRRLLQICQSPLIQQLGFNEETWRVVLILSGLFCFFVMLPSFYEDIRTGHTRFTRSGRVKNTGRFGSNSTLACENTSQNNR